jgi:hypothetical protein
MVAREAARAVRRHALDRDRPPPVEQSAPPVSIVAPPARENYLAIAEVDRDDEASEGDGGRQHE